MKVTAEAARRFLVAGHYLAPARSLAGLEGVLEVFRRLGSIQFDPIAAAGRNHDLVLHARVAGYEPAWCDALYERRELFEVTNKARIPALRGRGSPRLGHAPWPREGPLPGPSVTGTSAAHSCGGQAGTGRPQSDAMDGWALPPGSRTWHAYAGAWSLCRRQSPAPARLRPDPGAPMCLACRKAAILRRAMIGVDRVELRERAEAPAWTPPPGQRPPRRRRGGR